MSSSYMSTLMRKTEIIVLTSDIVGGNVSQTLSGHIKLGKYDVVKGYNIDIFN